VGGFKASATLSTRERDGFYDNVPDPVGIPLAGPPSGSEFQSQQSDAARVAVQWDISEDWTANYAFDYSDQDNDPRLGQLTQTSLNSFLSSGGLQDAYLTNEDDRADRASNDKAFYERAESQGHALDLTWTGENIQLRSITAYRELEFEDLLDIDGTPIDVFSSGRFVEYDSFSQEFQISGSTDRLDYLFGLFYFREDADVFNPITFFGAFGVPTSNNRYGLEGESIAAFGQVDWRPEAFEDRLTVTLGLRWTEEEKDQYVEQPGNYAAQADDTFNNTSPALALAYAITDDVNVYGRVALGWKSGGFNGEASSEARFLNAYDDEEVTSYELGIKSRLMDGRLQVNAAVFYNDIENFQLSVFEGAAAASLVENVPEFVTQGFELEAIAQVTEDLRLNLSYGYLDAEYEEFSNDFTLFSKDEAGVPYSPENSLSLGLDWTIARTSWGEWDFHADYAYRDDYTPFIDPDQVAASQIESRSLLNARLALRDVELGGGMLTVALWGQNILDEEYRINTIPFGGVDQQVVPGAGSGVGWTASYFGDPRTYGVEVRYDF
ncbi:MAG: TonB-dependent receptor, partial [Halieaceae bacterium]|nr:TonB-dependent receptor [Halieaceae bacterium]